MQAEESGEEPGTPGATSPSSRAPGVPWWGGTCGQLAQGMGKPAYGQNVDDNSGGTTATFPHVHHSNGGQDLQEDAPAVDSPSVEGHSTATQPGSEENGSDDSQQTPVTGVPPPGEYMLRHPQLELGHPMVRAAYPYAEQYFGGIVAAYGPQAMMHPQLLGMQHSRMPLPSEMMEEEPVYVNAKQYHGILRRRQIRAKAELENKLVKTRKPYLHESRHQHALRRARGCGGRFLNTKTKEEMAKEAAASASNERASQSRQNNHNEEGRQGPGTDGTNLNSNTAGQNGKSQGSSYANQLFHSSAFHPLSGGCDGGENAQGNNLTSKSSQQMAVATQ